MFKKRSIAGKNLRNKQEVPDEDGVEEVTVVTKVDVSTTKGLQATTISRPSDSAVQTGTVFKSTREVLPQSYSGDATHTSEIDTSTDRDARAILEKNILNNEKEVTAQDLESAIYKGQAAYKSFTKKDMSQVGANKHTGTQGPIRAPSFLRSSCRFDYQPDICKDYKETGFCGYGDQCKFLHDRGDYKSGWQLEKEWDENIAKKKKQLERAAAQFDDNGDLINGGEQDGVGEGGEENFEIDEDETLPFACFICREDFVDPVVTNCGHYFCGECAREKAKKSGKCQVCEKQTFGVFNRADKLIKKLVSQGKMQPQVPQKRIKVGKSSGSSFSEAVPI